MEKIHTIPIISEEFKREILQSIFKRKKLLYADFSVKPCSFPADFVSPAEDMFEKMMVSTKSFTVSHVVKLEQDGKSFHGSFFFNHDEILINTFSTKCEDELHAIGFYDKPAGGTMVFMIAFPEPLPLKVVKHNTNEGKRLFSFPPKSFVSHFGSGTYTPKLDDLLKKEGELELPGCPYKNPSQCKYYKLHKKCAFNQKDNVCRLIVSMTATSRVTPKTRI